VYDFSTISKANNGQLLWQGAYKAAFDVVVLLGLSAFGLFQGLFSLFVVRIEYLKM
jgi:hypothetical protein